MMTFGSRFEALRTHTSLVVTISEEKLLHESNLKVIMARVNGMCEMYIMGLLSKIWLEVLDPAVVGKLQNSYKAR